MTGIAKQDTDRHCNVAQLSCGGVRSTRGLPSLRPSHRGAGWGTGFSYGGFFENGQVVSAGNTLSGPAFMPITTGGKHSMAFGGSCIATLLAITAVRSQPLYPFRLLSFWLVTRIGG